MMALLYTEICAPLWQSKKNSASLMRNIGEVHLDLVEFGQQFGKIWISVDSDKSLTTDGRRKVTDIEDWVNEDVRIDLDLILWAQSQWKKWASRVTWTLQTVSFHLYLSWEKFVNQNNFAWTVYCAYTMFFSSEWKVPKFVFFVKRQWS